jgi:hypothetical protein
MKLIILEKGIFRKYNLKGKWTQMTQEVNITAIKHKQDLIHYEKLKYNLTDFTKHNLQVSGKSSTNI